MSDEQTLAAFLGKLEGTLSKIHDRLERLEGQPTQAEVEEQESFPDWNEDVPSGLSLVPSLDVEITAPSPEKHTALGEAFKARAAALPPPPPSSTVDHWDTIGDIPSASETVRGDGHVLSNEEIAAHYRRDQRLRQNPGRMAEDGPITMGG